MANQINRRKFITLGALATSALALGNVGSSIVRRTIPYRNRR